MEKDIEFLQRLIASEEAEGLLMCDYTCDAGQTCAHTCANGTCNQTS